MPPPAALPLAETGGLKRSAAFGTNSTPLRSSVVMVAVAVIPGRSKRSLLSTESTAWYVTTVCPVVGKLWTETTLDEKAWPFQASTKKVAVCPSLTLPTSASSMSTYRRS